MIIEVRSPSGELLGRIHDLAPSLLRRTSVRFACARDTRYFGAGLRVDLPHDAIDLSMQTIEMTVGEFITRPRISEDGAYYPGSVEFTLIWDGPRDVLDSISAFSPL